MYVLDRTVTASYTYTYALRERSYSQCFDATVSGSRGCTLSRGVLPLQSVVIQNINEIRRSLLPLSSNEGWYCCHVSVTAEDDNCKSDRKLKAPGGVSASSCCHIIPIWTGIFKLHGWRRLQWIRLYGTCSQGLWLRRGSQETESLSTLPQKRAPRLRINWPILNFQPSPDDCKEAFVLSSSPITFVRSLYKGMCIFLSMTDTNSLGRNFLKMPSPPNKY